MDNVTPTQSYPQGVLDNVLSEENLQELISYLTQHPDLPNIPTDEFGRKLLGSNTESILVRYSELLLPVARQFFGSETLVPSYSLFAEYSGDDISLHKHTDANACTYTIDLVLYQNEPWSLFVGDQEYVLDVNQAALFMGEAVPHWRTRIVNNTNKIGLAFFHYVEPDHWWFTEGPEHVEVIREIKRSTSLYEN